MNTMYSSKILEDDGAYRDASLGRLLHCLLVHLKQRRRVQLAGVFVLMIVGALAEVLTIGAIIPFLSLAADPNAVKSLPLLGIWLERIGLNERGLLTLAAIVFAVTAVIAGAVRLLLAWAGQKFIFRVGHDIGVSVFSRVVHQPYSYHISRNSSRFISDFDRVQTVTIAILLPMMTAAASAVISVFIVSALIAIDPMVAFTAALGFGALYTIVSRLMRHRLRRNSSIISACQTERVRTIQEASGAVRDVILDKAQPAYIRRFANVDLPYRDAQGSNAFIGAAPRFIIEGFGLVLFASIVVAVAGRPGGMAAAMPILGALAVGAVRLLPMLQLIYNGWAQIVGNRQSLVEVIEALDLPMDKETAIAAPLSFEKNITLEDVHFGYPTGAEPVLRDVNLTVPKGSRVGIIGQTGSGKSTLMDLILGLLIPDKGRILVDDTPLEPNNQAAWQARVAHVPQAIYLADSSVAENIAFAIHPDKIDMARVHRAAEKAALADVIAALPQGYQTFVGERGIRLSGGQRQRIAIARALYRNADVLVFDEATSALDSDTETEVMKAINDLSRELTIFIIAHRTSTLTGCDVRIDLSATQIMGHKRYAGSETVSVAMAGNIGV